MHLDVLQNLLRVIKDKTSSEEEWMKERKGEKGEVYKKDLGCTLVSLQMLFHLTRSQIYIKEIAKTSLRKKISFDFFNDSVPICSSFQIKRATVRSLASGLELSML